MHSTLCRTCLVLLATGLGSASTLAQQSTFRLTESEVFARDGVSVMAFQDIYPEGHQSGVVIIQHGERVTTGGDLRLEPTPGQWQPVPRQEERVVDAANGTITTRLSYPDPSRNRTGFNPIEYPDLNLSYRVTVRAEGDAVRIVVDLDEPLPTEWVGKVGLNMELYPGSLFGKSWTLGSTTGIFPRQPGGPMRRDAGGQAIPAPLASGPRLVVAPEDPLRRLSIESVTGELELLDGRNQHNNGWFVARSLVPAGATTGAVEWIVRPHAVPGWRSAPVVQVSQVGYHPRQRKVAVIELDARDDSEEPARLLRITEEGPRELRSAVPERFGPFLRYAYRRFDFSDVTEPGLYQIVYRDATTIPFRIATDVFRDRVWQPTVEYFLPVQMCHMRVEEQYRVWHGACHLDDARMAPTAYNHFDGYLQGPSTLTPFQPGQVVPGLNAGGWHDAGDDDLRIESQADEVFVLAAAYEEFGVDYDNTTVDQDRALARIHQPDGKPDLLQQVEHGVLSILGAYRSLGRLYRGIIVPTLPQYVLLGDVVNSTDNLFHDPTLGEAERTATHSGLPDDRWLFTEEHAGHEFKGIRALAIAGRVLEQLNPELAAECVTAAERLWAVERNTERAFADQVAAAVELLLTTRKPRYRAALLEMRDRLLQQAGLVGWQVGRALPLLEDAAFAAAFEAEVAQSFARVQELQRQNPYGVPYRPHIWGAGWGIQEFGVQQYFLHRSFPESVSPEYLLNALNFVLGTHPGSNTASFVSGVGARSMTTGYGLNRADWSYIPGGVVSGTALIRPDFPELKEFPYLWQQSEYVMGGGASNFMFLALAADEVLNR